MIERSIYLHSSPSSWPHFSWACSRKNSCFETLSLKSQTFGGNNQQLLNINLQFVLRPVFHTWTRGTGCQGGHRGSQGRPSCSPSPPPSSCKPPGQGAHWVKTLNKRASPSSLLHLQDKQVAPPGSCSSSPHCRFEPAQWRWQWRLKPNTYFDHKVHILIICSLGVTLFGPTECKKIGCGGWSAGWGEWG